MSAGAWSCKSGFVRESGSDCVGGAVVGVYVCTYPTMMNLINEMQDGRRRFSPGCFDLIVIDVAHRSGYQKAIFEYFDSLLVVFTATPKEEIDENTYSLFDLETGVPTDAYDLNQAIEDGFLVPPEAVSVPNGRKSHP